MAPTTTDPTDPAPPWSDDSTDVGADWTQALPPPPTTPSPRRARRPPRRRRSKVLLVAGIGFAAISIAYGCIILLDLLAWQETTTHHTFAGVERIELASHCGGVSIVGDRPDGGSTTVTRKVRRGLASPQADATQSGSTLRLHSSCPPFPQTFNDVTYQVHVPTAVAIAGSAAGGLHVTDVRGPLDVRSSDGGIDVTGAQSAVTAHSGSGSITVADSAGPLVLSTSDGGITVEGTRTPSVSAETGDGGIRLDLLDAPDRIATRTSDGGIDVTLPADAPAYKVTTDTGDGSVTTAIRIDPHAPRTIDAHTGDGSITLRLRTER